MADKSVVRNAQYRRGGLSVRQRHNERQNTDYMNDDIIKERAARGVHFKEPTGSYEQMFDSMLADGVISTRGLGKDPFIVDEMVFDVNTSYFENGGGYEYVKSFFAEAYRCAIEEIGGEQYVLSAVMHADERNKAVSERLGHDVYHYHLHVVYVPVVDKEIHYRKNNKDPELAGKLREVIKQVSHSKKWPKHKQYDENGEVIRNAKGKPILVNAYSLLQDHFHDHMKAAGFDGFERGERGSTAEHLNVLEYKTKLEAERAAALAIEVEYKQQTANALDKKAGNKQKQLEALTGQMIVAKKEKAGFEDIDRMGQNRTVTGNMSLAPADWGRVSELAKEGVKSRHTIVGLKKKLADLVAKITGLERRLKELESQKESVLANIGYHQARMRAPLRMAETIADIMQKPAEEKEKGCTASRQRRDTDGQHRWTALFGVI